MSATKVLVRGLCNSCGVAHGRPSPSAAFCRDCLRSRLAARRRTPQYRAHQAKYSQSPKGKIRRGLWLEANMERLRPKNLANYHRRNPQRTRQCQVFGCTNTFPQIKGSHAFLCRECARIIHGRWYARHRKAA